MHGSTYRAPFLGLVIISVNSRRFLHCTLTSSSASSSDIQSLLFFQISNSVNNSQKRDDNWLKAGEKVSS